jgi:hypothetical protein
VVRARNIERDALNVLALPVTLKVEAGNPSVRFDA